MKKLLLINALFIGLCLFQSASAQVHLGVHVNIGSQPEWGPEGYDYVNYYYLPDIDTYYDVNHHQYIYWGRGRWVYTTYLPEQYRDYDLYHGYKVIINEPRPWLHHDRHINEYRQYRGRHEQVIIRESHDGRYERYGHGWREGERRH